MEPDNIPVVTTVDGVVSLVTTQQVVVEQFSDLEAIVTEMAGINDAIADIENFKQRRLDNLQARLTQLHEAKSALEQSTNQ